MASQFFDEAFQKELKDFKALKFKDKSRHLKELKQVGSSDKKRDDTREALRPGKRISSTGKVYWETRKNRSDAKDSDL